MIQDLYWSSKLFLYLYIYLNLVPNFMPLKKSYHFVCVFLIILNSGQLDCCMNLILLAVIKFSCSVIDLLFIQV